MHVRILYLSFARLRRKRPLSIRSAQRHLPWLFGARQLKANYATINRAEKTKIVTGYSSTPLSCCIVRRKLFFRSVLMFDNLKPFSVCEWVVCSLWWDQSVAEFNEWMETGRAQSTSTSAGNASPQQLRQKRSPTSCQQTDGRAVHVYCKRYLPCIQVENFQILLCYTYSRDAERIHKDLKRCRSWLFW